MKLTKAQQSEREQAIAQLREWLKPGDTVYTVLRHVSRSGMQREIGIVLMQSDDGRRAVDLHPNYLVGKALGDRQGKRDGIIIGGCGMDMGFALVYNLGRTLFPDGFAHMMRKNGVEREVMPETKAHAEMLVGMGYLGDWGRNGDTSGWDNDGGYALKQRWI